MNFRDVEYIVKMAECGSINRAAKELYVAQPSLSKCIKKVEDEYDIQLYYRNRGSSINLTVEGQAFLDMARPVLELYHHFEQQLQELKEKNRSRIVFGTAPAKGYSISSALFKNLYLEYDKYFLDFRGTDPDFFKKEALKRGWTLWNMNPEDTDYLQNTYPVREEKNAVGHAVRAVYLYTGMAMAAVETKDASLADACERMWNSIVNRRMYLTGGIGSSADGEAFTLDYDLPNDTAYCETCASIGLIFFANAMHFLSEIFYSLHKYLR